MRVGDMKNWELRATRRLLQSALEAKTYHQRQRFLCSVLRYAAKVVYPWSGEVLLHIPSEVFYSTLSELESPLECYQPQISLKMRVGANASRRILRAKRPVTGSQTLDNLQGEIKSLYALCGKLGSNGFLIFRADLATLDTNHKMRFSAFSRAVAVAIDAWVNDLHLSTLEVRTQVRVGQNTSETADSIMRTYLSILPNLSVFTLWCVEPNSTQKNQRVRIGAHTGIRNPNRLALKQSSSGRNLRFFMRSPTPVFVEEASDLRVKSSFVREQGIKTFAAVPLRVGDIAIGIVFLNYRERHHFTRAEKRLIVKIAEQSASVLNDALLRDALRQSNFHRDEVLTLIAELGSENISLDQVLRVILQRLRNLLRQVSPAICIYLFNQQTNKLVLHPVSSEYYDFIDQARVRSLDLNGTSILCRVARESIERHRALLETTENVSADEDFLVGRSGTASQVCISLMGTGSAVTSAAPDLLGVLVVESSEPSAFDNLDRVFVQSICKQIAIVLERSQAHERLRFSTAIALQTAWVAEFEHESETEFALLTGNALLLSDSRSKFIRGVGLRIRQSTAKLQALARTEQAELTFDQSDVLIVQWLRHWRGNYLASLDPKHAVNIILEPGNSESFIRANESALGRIFRHLCNNSLHHMRKRGQIFIRTRKVNSQWFEVRFEDTGPGIQPETWPHLLNSRVQSTRGGTGLGLLIVRFLVEQMEGTIRAEPPVPNRGAEFVIGFHLS
jgi:signal transduction histidine kinase